MHLSPIVWHWQKIFQEGSGGRLGWSPSRKWTWRI